jgi:hypothetical protein
MSVAVVDLALRADLAKGLDGLAAVELRRKFKAGASVDDLVEEYADRRVTRGTICAALTGVNWASVDSIESPIPSLPSHMILTPLIVAECRQRAQTIGFGATGRLAREFGVTRAAMSRALSGDTWASVPGAIKVPKRKLSDEQIVEARSLLGTVRLAEIAKRFGVTTDCLRYTLRKVAARKGTA